MSLHSGATIETVWPRLTHPREYVARVRHLMGKCAAAHSSAFVCIGVTGSGQKPCFRISSIPSGQEAEAIFGSYWDTGDALDNEKALNTNWSTAWMSYSEVDGLLRAKLGWKGG